MNSFHLDDALSVDELKQIESVLAKYGNDISLFSASQLHGFLTAVVSGPRMMAPSEWLSAVWGGEELAPEWENQAEFGEFFSLVLRMYHHVLDDLDQFQDEFEALCLIRTIDGKKERMFDLWCHGYMTAYEMNSDEWGEMAEELFMFPMSAIVCDLQDSDIYKISAEKKAELIELVEPAAIDIFNFWKERREPEAALPISNFLPNAKPSVPFKRDKQKIGPNQPCPCGSGRKYKKCCLN